jgi:hypothetical protein
MYDMWEEPAQALTTTNQTNRCFSTPPVDLVCWAGGGQCIACGAACLITHCMYDFTCHHVHHCSQASHRPKTMSHPATALTNYMACRVALVCASCSAVMNAESNRNTASFKRPEMPHAPSLH